jgi:hypothetical protein
MMKDLIRKRIREQMIDGQNMNQGTQTACNTMSVATYKPQKKTLKCGVGYQNLFIIGNKKIS